MTEAAAIISPQAGKHTIDLGVTHRETLVTGVQLFVAPRHVMKWDHFVQASPSFSIALDGYVHGAPRFDSKGPRLNLNHHKDVD